MIDLTVEQQQMTKILAGKTAAGVEVLYVLTSNYTSLAKLPCKESALVENYLWLLLRS